MAQKKSTQRKTAAKKSAVKKSAAKKAVTKKAAAKKTTSRKRTATSGFGTDVRAPQLTTVVAQVDVGWGNSVYIRGEGPGLSWDKGKLMDWNNDAWTWSTANAVTGVTFKFCLNDEIWSEGENLTVPAGGTSITTPVFDA